MTKKISILGSTGSIGTQTLKVIGELKDLFDVVALAAGNNVELLVEQIEQFSPEFVSLTDDKSLKKLQERFPKQKFFLGKEGLQICAAESGADLVMSAVSGAAGMLPTLKALENGIDVALANKETLVAGGKLVTDAAKKSGAALIPVDSEHSALFQCLQGEDIETVHRLILTASGGPFRLKSAKELEEVTLEDALSHPTWSMGAKVSIDSSTLMNKGLEVIEARWLFDMPPEKIDVVVHPQSVIHSMVEFSDKSMIAQASLPTMEIPIQYALTYPKRVVSSRAQFDFLQTPVLEFFLPAREKFPCLQLAFDALEAGKSTPCFLNAANEVLVSLFLNRKIRWIDISRHLQKIINDHIPSEINSLEDVLEVDHLARARANEVACSTHT